MTTAMPEVDRLTRLDVRTDRLLVQYGSTVAVRDLSLELGAGRIHGLLGRNGAGKTSLLSTLASLLAPSSGSVQLGGQQPFENEQVMERVCLIRESGDLITGDTIATNLDYLQRARPTFDRGFAQALLADFDIPTDRKLQTLSRGQRSAVGAAIGLACRAPLTMFDEVHLGMDAPSRQLFYDALLADFATYPRTIIVSSHLVAEIEQLLETVTILHRGELLLSADLDDIRGRGATLTGPSALVEEHSRGHRVIGTRDLGPTRQVTLFGDLDPPMLQKAERQGLHVGAVPLQDLFIHLTAAAKDQTR